MPWDTLNPSLYLLLLEVSPSSLPLRDSFFSLRMSAFLRSVPLHPELGLFDHIEVRRVSRPKKALHALPAESLFLKAV